MPISTINQNGLNAPLTLTAPVFSGNVTATTITSPAATALTLQSAGTTAVTINTSRNVGIGTTTPSGKLHTFQSAAQDSTVQFEAGTAGYASNLNLIANTAPGGAYNNITSFSGSSAEWRIGGSGNNSTIVFSTGSGYTERMRIDSSGYVGIGNSSPGSVPARLVVSQGGNIAYFQQNAAGGYCGQFDATVNGGTYYFVNFLKAGVGISNITSNGTTISYNTGSDYRLKDNIEPITNALETVAKLKPSKWNWKEFWGGGSSQGFIAHELQAIVPDCVTGEKDAVETYTDENGNEQTRIKPQGVDTSFLVATLTAAIQELKAEFDAYKASHP